jgi:hypothetical protein
MRPGAVQTVKTAPPRTVAAVLLSRRSTVYLPESPHEPTATPHPVVAAGVTLLEADLLERGLLMSPALRDRFVTLDVDTMKAHGQALLADLDAALGADRPHVPLFRGFPRSVPHNTLALWVDRVVTLLFQHPDQPCVLCGKGGTVHAVSPCAHLVCDNCFDGSDYSACPICRQRIDLDDPFLRPAEPRRRGRALDLPARARVVFPGNDSTVDAYAEVAAMLARPNALAPQDADDLRVLLKVHSRTELGWLPETIPARETKAIVLDWLARDPATLSTVESRIETATDALRMLVVRSGGDPGLVEVPHFTSVPRPLRKTILAALDRLDPRNLVEDLRRRPRLWISAAERLHPFEYARAHPRAAAAFATLRQTPLADDRLAERLREIAPDAGLSVDRQRLTYLTFAGRVERHLAAGEIGAAVRLLANRPGEFLRRLDHVLRTAGTDVGPVLEALPGAAAHVAPAVLLSALGELRVRGERLPRRVYFPKGGNARAHVVDDVRPPLPAEVVASVTATLTAEVLDRAARLPSVERAVIDRTIEGLIAPFTQRTAARALVTLPRGSALPVPDGQTLRLFVHWMEHSGTRVDLDLSGAFFNADWEHVGTCDYTSKRWERVAVHSGDLTSAPEPLGASEFLDIDVDRMRESGARYVVLVVFSYNDVPFDEMVEAFAGLMLRTDAPDEGRIFEPRTVEQRFDLAGKARACVPFVLDAQTRTLRWLDVVKGVTGTFHAVHRHSDDLSRLGEALTDLYGSGARVGLGELARWHAAARASTVDVRVGDGTVARYRRREGESVAAFADRLASDDADGVSGVGVDRSGVGGSHAGADSAGADSAGADSVGWVSVGGESVGGADLPELAFLYRGDIPLANGAQVYAVHPAGLRADSIQLLAADDVAGLLLA